MLAPTSHYDVIALQDMLMLLRFRCPIFRYFSAFSFSTYRRHAAFYFLRFLMLPPLIIAAFAMRHAVIDID